MIQRQVRGKYGAVKTQINGITFASKAESRRYVELKTLEDAGHIRDLQLQKKFLLVPAKRNADGYLEREVSYSCDFAYVDHLGRQVIEDVKSRATCKNPEYVIKRKLMLQVHGITVVEVGCKARK